MGWAQRVRARWCDDTAGLKKIVCEKPRRDAREAKQKMKPPQRSVRPSSLLDWLMLYVHYYNKRELVNFLPPWEFFAEIEPRPFSILTQRRRDLGEAREKQDTG